CVMLLALAIRTSTLHAVPPADGGYRTFDGTSNNLEHPWWGSAGSHLLRGSGGAHYADGISAIGGSGRPSPRAVSNALFDQRIPVYSSIGLSDYIWTWGQFLDHDFGLNPGLAESAPIQVPQDDPFFDPAGTGTETMPFHRSVFDPLTGITSPR